ncbi:hypothetical protein ACPV4Z_17075 [Vibrio aestuarianus]|uniref:hypothetical protein n=1 Tax=Vibrio aestuarianus TaxID=28171 RepID=UPI0040687339
MTEKSVELFWSAADIVRLLEVVAWPIASITIAVLLRGKISQVFQSLFNNRSVTEVSAAGFSAKFSDSKQASTAPENIKENAVAPTSVGKDAAEILERQKLNETKFSRSLLNNLKTHRESLKLTSEQAIELVEKELSLTQARAYFVDLNRVLYRSQFNLFNQMKINNGSMSAAEVLAYFSGIKAGNPSVFSNTDLHSYLAYPMRVGLVEKNHEEYSLTEYGDSYVEFMDRNTHLIGELAQN